MDETVTTLVLPCYWANQKLVKMTKDCYYSLKDSGYQDLVLIINDGSPVSAQIGGTGLFRQIDLPNNKGYAGAVNMGLALAEGDVYIVANNDIEFIDPHWLDHLLKPIKEGAGISTIRSTEPDGWFTEDVIEEDAYFGNIWAITRESYELLGPLDESLGKGYHEDADYRRRALEAGIRVVKNHNGLVEHHGKATFKVIDPNDESFMKSREKLIEKWGELF